MLGAVQDARAGGEFARNHRVQAERMEEKLQAEIDQLKVKLSLLDARFQTSMGGRIKR